VPKDSWRIRHKWGGGMPSVEKKDLVGVGAEGNARDCLKGIRLCTPVFGRGLSLCNHVQKATKEEEVQRASGRPAGSNGAAEKGEHGGGGPGFIKQQRRRPRSQRKNAKGDRHHGGCTDVVKGKLLGA